MVTIKSLRQKYSAVPPADFDILIAHALRKPKEFLYTHPNTHLSLLEHVRARYLLSKRNRGWSVAALTHHKQFFGLDFYVNRHTLIPRPDTEMLVETALETIKKTNNQNTVLIDVGTGSGCIPVSILKTTKIKTFATDISRPALRVAHKNARTHNVFIKFFHGNLLTPVTTALLRCPPTTLIITANLPYLTQNQFNSEPSIQHEPHSALVAKNDGLALYETLLQQIQLLLTKKPIPLSAFFEIDPSQSEPIKLLIKNYLPTAATEIKTDLAGRDRLVCITVKN